MSTKSKFNFSGLKTALSRTKQIVSNKLGKGQNTQDIQFEEINKEMSQYVEVIKATQRHIHQYMKTLREMTKQEQELLEMYSHIFESSSQVSSQFSQFGVFVGAMETFRTNLEDSLRTQIDEPIEDYRKQFELMKKRVDERKRRLIDLDRYRQDYEKMQQKGGDMEKVRVSQTKYLNMKKAYEELNEELKQDIPRLVTDKSNFYSPLFAMLVYHQMEYYKGSHGSILTVCNSLSNIDSSAAHRHMQVITPEENSAHTMQINLDGPVNDDDLEEGGGGHEDHNQAPPPQQNHNQPPPQQNYNQPPPQQNYPPQGGYSQPPPQQGGYPPQGGMMGGGMPPQKMAPKGPMKTMPPAPKKQGGMMPPKKVPMGKRAKGMYPFQGQDGSELSFNVGDVLIIHKDQGDWWEAELNGQRGLIPGNYVQLI